MQSAFPVDKLFQADTRTTMARQDDHRKDLDNFYAAKFRQCEFQLLYLAYSFQDRIRLRRLNRTTTMELPAAILEKIRSNDLRNEAIAENSEPHSVIVELDLPTLKLELANRRTSGLRGKTQFRFSTPTSEEVAEAGQEASKIAASKESIATITGRLPDTYLSASGSFVVRANGEQIGRIASISTVSAIWPNSNHGR